MNQAKRMILPPSPAGQEYPYVAEGWYLYANANSKYRRKRNICFRATLRRKLLQKIGTQTVGNG
jgi:hypothetical protein